MNQIAVCFRLAVAAAALVAAPAWAADLATLTAENWSEFVPQGKEVDAIYGDYVLRNEHLVAVIAQPVAGRNANMTVRDVNGAVIDLTTRENPNDQLSCFYPTSRRYAFTELAGATMEVDGEKLPLRPSVRASGERITLTLASQPRQDGSRVLLTYSLADGERHLTVVTRHLNEGEKAVQGPLEDAVRADRTFVFGDDADARLYWFYDEWFPQSYGVTCQDRLPRAAGGGRQAVVQYADADGSTELRLAPGEEYVLERRLYPRRNVLQTRSYALRQVGAAQRSVTLAIEDPQGAVANARLSVTLQGQEQPIGVGRGARFWFALPPGEHLVEVAALGRPPLRWTTPAAGKIDQTLRMESCGYVSARVTDAEGQAIPCKTAFFGQNGTETPDFGPDSGAVTCGNVHYSASGELRQELAPGTYELIFSRGPEYDAVFRKVEVRAGETTEVQVELPRVVDTTGWVSTEYHSHSSPSGDNTGSQLGRVLNLLCEHLEFAPCTEHNRIDSYTPHLKRLDAERWMATCPGMELTGGPLPVNHQNAFPLKRSPRTQDGGGPLTDVDPVQQIRRLAMWNDSAEKLVQSNHPNLMQIYGDRDLDGKPDEGFRGMFDYMDVIEVHPPEAIFDDAQASQEKYPRGNTIFQWMQLLNQGYRIPGVVNTDAHYNLHGSGWLRNYVVSSTDDPREIDTMEMVRNSSGGRSVMSTGPFMEVVCRSGGTEVGPGQDLAAEDKKVVCRVKVQCPNWLDVNRVQVFVNGRAVPAYNFTRRQQPEMFGNGVVKFEQEIEIALDRDAHLIVAAIGEGLELGRVMGGSGRRPPVAVANPVFVDVDGQGFQPNRDDLDSPLPIKP